MQRRTFVRSTLLAAAAPRLWPQSAPSWGGPVIDTHLHLRRDPDSCFTHMQGCGVTHAVLGKWVARETLILLKSLTTPEIFHQIVWENANRVFKLRLQYPLSPA
jgi:hypothetical protein